MKGSRKFPRLHLYDDPSAKTLDIKGIAEYLEDLLGNADVVVRPEFASYHLRKERLADFARGLAKARVKDPMKEFSHYEPFFGEVDYEARALASPQRRLSGILYDGFHVQRLYGSVLGEEAEAGSVHVAFTSRLVGTLDESDRRYHARVNVCGFPSLISTTGVVEAPAKPREFYYALRNLAMSETQTVIWEELKGHYKGRFIDYDDERLTEVMKGYVIQAVFYHILQEPFCSSKGCRLYNAHWQEEVIEAQLSRPEYCEYHEGLIKEIREGHFDGYAL